MNIYNLINELTQFGTQTRILQYSSSLEYEPNLQVTLTKFLPLLLQDFVY